MVKIKEAILVEGRYDANTLHQVVDATIFETAGFGIFKDRQKMDMLRRVAEKRGLIVLTDSDGAGFVIRNYLKGALPKGCVKQAYVPDIAGKERRKRAEEVMERVAISHRAKHYPSQLSGGQQQRTAIARAILPRPKLILADEPTGNLDSKNGKEVMDLLSELHKEGTTIVMVTHSLHDANYADRVINMFDGEIVNQVEM